MSDRQREDALDCKLSGQNPRDRLIDSAAAIIAGQAYELMLSHSISGEWPESESRVKAEHDMLLEIVGELRDLKGNFSEKPNNSDRVVDDNKMVKGDLVQAGKLTMRDAEYERAVVIAFDDDDSARKAIQSGQCRFTVFGGGV